MAKSQHRKEFHGHTTGGQYHPLYSTWAQMISRCESPAARGYADYGGRGIRVCQRWRDSFAAFLADMGGKPTPAHTIDRIDVNGHYEPGNCRWATQAEQQRNKRCNRLLTHGGRTMCLADWASALGVSVNTLAMRVRLGWSDSDILAVPVAKRTQGLRLVHDGQSLSVDEWSSRTGIKAATIYRRIKRLNWDVYRALTTPTIAEKRNRLHRPAG